MSFKTRMTTLLILTTAAVLCIAILYQMRPPDRVTIGYLGTLSGKISAQGLSARDGAILAMEDVNFDDKNFPIKISLDIRDDQGDPARALELMQDFHARGVHLTVGPLITATASHILDFLNAKQILTIGPAIAGANLEHRDDFFIKLFPSTREFGSALGQLAQRKGLRHLVALLDSTNEDYAATLIEGARTVPGLELESITFDGSATPVQYVELATQALSKTPDAVLFVTSPIDTALLSQHIRQNAPAIPLLSSSRAIANDLLTNGGKAIEGLMFYLPYNHEGGQPAFESFRSRFTKRFGVAPTHAALFNYEAVILLANAIASTHVNSPEAVRSRILQAKGYQGLQDRVSIDDFGDSKRPLHLHTVEDGIIRVAERDL